MNPGIPETHLALARYSGRLRRQHFEILRFDDEGLHLIARDEVAETLPYPAMEKLRYRHFPRTMPQMLRMMSGGMFGRQEAVLEVQTAKGNRAFVLERDLEFRLTALRQLFEALYRAGIPLRESTFAGTPAFLLEAMPGPEADRRIAELRDA